MKPDHLISSINCELHFRYAIKLGILPPETSQLPIATLTELYPQMQDRGISYYMVEQVKDAMAEAHLTVEPVASLDYFKKSDHTWLLEMSSIVRRSTRKGEGNPSPVVAAANAVFFVDKFHANLGIHHYESAITRSKYMNAFYPLIPESVLPVMPAWLKGEGW